MLQQRQGNNKRRGIVAILVAAMIVGLLGIVAIALDGGFLQDNKRRVQSAADAAALAAATTLYENYPKVNAQNPDPGGLAAAAAQQNSSTNGFPNDGTTTSVVVNIPPTSGPFANMISYVEVIITYQQSRHFSAIWGSNTLPVVARAVAKGFWGDSKDGVIVLDPTAKSALNASGGGSVTLTGTAHFITNSNNAAAGAVTGGGSLTAPQFDFVGGTVGPFNGPVTTNNLPTPDPLAYLPVPPVPPDGTITKKNHPGGGTDCTLTPGRYTNLPNFTNGDTVTLKQASANNAGGIYYLDGTSFTSNGANIGLDPNTTGGVMFYLNPTSGAQSQSVGIQGNVGGSIVLSPLTSGPYAGILFWQNRTATQTMSITGNGTINLSGTLYAANAQLTLGGNGTATIGSQLISRTLNLTGGGSQLINYSPPATGRKREVRLAE
jgi:hypothetical protein